MIALIILAIVTIDRIFKSLVVSQSDFTFNNGFAFGIFPSNFSAIISIALLTFLTVHIYKKKGKINAEKYAFALVFAGAISNIIDRILYNGVVDYIDLPLLPVFNIADIAIVISLSSLLILEFKNARKI